MTTVTKTPFKSDTMISEAEQWKACAIRIPLRRGPSVPPTEAIISRLNEYWPLNRAENILDIGCGHGVVTAHLLWNHGLDIPANASLLATDFSEHMLSTFRDLRADEIAKSDELSPIWTRVQDEVVDAQDLSRLLEGSVSHAMSGYMYFMLPDPRKGLTEVKRVLCQNGVFAQSSWKGNSWLEATRRALKLVDREAPVLRPQWGTIEGVRNELEWAGFRDIEVHEVETYMELTTHEDSADMMLKIPATKNCTHGLSEDDQLTLRNGLVEEFKKLCPTAPGRLPGTAIVSIARK